MSHEVLTEQEELIVLNAIGQLLFESSTIATAFYSIICNESSYIAKTEQLSLYVRYITDTYDIHKDCSGVLPCDKGLKLEALLDTYATYAGADPDIRHIRKGECQILWPKNCPL